MTSNLNIPTFSELRPNQQTYINDRSYPHQPSLVSLFGKLGAGTFSSLGITSFLLSQVQWGLKQRAGAAVILSIPLIVGSVYQVDRFAEGLEMARVKTIQSLIRQNNFTNGQYTAIKIGERVFYITKIEYSEQKPAGSYVSLSNCTDTLSTPPKRDN